MLERVPEARLEALAEAAEAYVDDAFGQRLGLVPVAPTNLPHFILDRYAIWQGSLNGRTLLLMAIKEILPPGSGATAQYLKHRDLVQRELGADLVLLLLDRAPNAIRRQMVDRKIGFIAPGAQLYVPEAFLDLRERAPAFAIASAASDQPHHAIPAACNHAGPQPGRSKPHRTCGRSRRIDHEHQPDSG
jgi:hypothetical protein